MLKFQHFKPLGSSYPLETLGISEFETNPLEFELKSTSFGRKF